MMLEDLYRLLRSGHIQAQGIVDTMTQPIVVLDYNMCVATANNAFIRTFHVERDDIISKNFFGLGNGQWEIPELKILLGSVIPKAAAVIGYEVKHDFPSIGQRTFLVDARRLVHPDDNSAHILVLFNDVTETQRQDTERDFMLAETRHRMKNLLAVVRSVAMQTEAEGRTGVEYRDVFLGRLKVTLQAQELAATKQPADFQTLLVESVGEVGAGRLECSGPEVTLSSSEVFPISMIFHELTTNAAKYGALSVPGGHIEVVWSVEPDPKDHAHVTFRWRERSGPPVVPPTRKGYGTELIEGLCRFISGTVELNYNPRWLRCFGQISGTVTDDRNCVRQFASWNFSPRC